MEQVRIPRRGGPPKDVQNGSGLTRPTAFQESGTGYDGIESVPSSQHGAIRDGAARSTVVRIATETWWSGAWDGSKSHVGLLPAMISWRAIIWGWSWSRLFGDCCACSKYLAALQNRVSNGETSLASFDHERLDVYRVALDFLVTASNIVENLPKGRAYLADQLNRAATSIVLNIAEGAGEFSPADKARFYRIARRSATESAACLDVCAKLSLIDQNQHSAGRDQLLRLVAMLVRLSKPSGTGTGTGTGTGAPSDLSDGA